MRKEFVRFLTLANPCGYDGRLLSSHGKYWAKFFCVDTVMFIEFSILEAYHN